MRILRLTLKIIFIISITVWLPTICLSDADYKIGPGDILRITVYDHPDLNVTVRVGNDGNINFPLAGQIEVDGETTASASKLIEGKLDGDYIINPQVSVFVEEFRSKKVVIVGEVVRPGLYELSGPTTLLELISKAGGLTDKAGQSATIRHSSKDGSVQEPDIQVVVQDLLKSGLDAVDIQLKDGDTVNVPKAGLVYVTGQVNRPSAYPIEDGTTVIKAITMAGGFTQLAAQAKIKIIRTVNGKEQVLERVSLHDLLRPEDVMVVPESFF